MKNLKKYIGKDLGDNSFPFKQYYFCSKKLNRSNVLYKSKDGLDLTGWMGELGLVPSFEFQDYYCKVYRVDNKSLVDLFINQDKKEVNYYDDALSDAKKIGIEDSVRIEDFI